MNTTWILQRNVEASSQSGWLLKKACRQLGLPVFEIEVPPAASAPPAMPELAGPFVFHGRTRLIRLAKAHPRWHLGIFFEEALFRPSIYENHYGSRMLNLGAERRTWRELIQDERRWSEQVFLRPDDDLKRFTGEVASLRQWITRFRELQSRGVEIHEDSEVLLNRPIEVDAEWRLFVVDGEVISGSRYRPGAELDLPAEMLDFAQSAIKEWTPAPVFVLDIARAERSWKIVECNCFNGSGFYRADVASIVAAVSRYQEGRQLSI